MSSTGSSRPQLSPDGESYWNGSSWVSLVSTDGTQRWDGKAWVARKAPERIEPPAAAPVPAVPTAELGLDLDNLPSWLSAESAQVVLGGGGTLAAPMATPGPVSPPPTGAAQPHLAPAGGSTWVDQTYRTDAASPPTAKANRLLIGGAAVLILVVALGGALVYQQMGNGTAAPPAADITHLPAAGLLSAAKSSISNAGSYHLVASEGTVSQEITVSGPKDASIDIKSPAGTVSMMLTGGLQFLKAPAAFYADKNPILAVNAADQWIIVPADESLIPLTSVVDLAKTASCLVDRHGTLKKVGLTTVDGEQVIEVDDSGNVPSGTPAHLYFMPSSGQLAGIDVVGASTPGGSDPTCNGGLGIYTASFSAVQKYRFDHWGAVLNLQLPAGSIDLSQKPWCGAIVGSGLSAAVRQYLVAANTYSLKVEALSPGGCGCQPSIWALFSQAAMAEIAASDEFSAAIGTIAFQGQAKVDANAAVAAYHTRSGIMRQGLASGTFTGYHSSDAQRAPVEQAIADSVANLRADIGLPPGSTNCPVDLP